MNKVTRVGVFETNSSSTHSISIAGWSPSKKDTLTVENGVVSIFPGEFGWEEVTYHDAASKASYCYTYAKQTNRPELLERLAAVIVAETGCKVVQFETAGGEGYSYGYIDHQSCEKGDDDPGARALKSDESARNFIFNPKSVLVTDNDNH